MAFKFRKSADTSGEEKTPAKGKAYKASSGAKFVLFIGDEGAILVYIKGKVVQSRQFVPDASQPNLEELKQTLDKDPSAPLMMIADSMDQSYVPQTLPPVSKLSVNKLIKRRLDRDFGPNDIKGAVLLGREPTGRKDWNFLMISLEKSPQLTVWIDFISRLPNRFRGIYLVSVEAEILVKNLEQVMGVGKGGTGSEWKFFVSHNKVGGFRQVILRHGRIVFTRLAQPLGDSNAEVIAGNIEQEMLSTIEYMKRLSFSAQAGLDIYIIAADGIRKAIDPAKFNASSVHILTPYEMAEYMGIEGATQPTDQFGDVILAALIGSSKKHVLTLSVPQSRRLDRYYHMIYAQRGAAALAALGILGYAGSIGYDIYTLNVHMEEMEKKKSTEQQRLTQLRDEIAKANLDINKATDLIDLYTQMQNEKISPAPTMNNLQPLIKPPVLVKAVDWSLADKSSNPGAPSQGGTMALVVTLEFPPFVTQAKIFKALTSKLLAEVKAAFKPPYEVNYLDLPTTTPDNDKLEVDFSKDNAATQEAEPSKPITVKLSIKGDVSADQPQPPR